MNSVVSDFWTSVYFNRGWYNVHIIVSLLMHVPSTLNFVSYIHMLASNGTAVGDVIG